MAEIARWCVGAYTDADAFLAACRAARGRGLAPQAWAPYPVHGLEDALGLERSWIGRPVFATILVGFVVAFAGLYHLGVIDYPINVSGKPFFAWQTFVVMTLEVGLLLGALVNMAVAFHACRLLPLPETALVDARQTDDRFLIALPVTGDGTAERDFLAGTGAEVRLHTVAAAEAAHA
jgi:hypothetical protein